MTRAPGPRGSLIWGSLSGFSAAPLDFLAQAAQAHGDVVRFRFGPVTAHLVNHPAHIEHVLSRNTANYDKATRSARRIAATTGDSLLSANASAWKRHRTLIQPLFQPRCFAGIGPQIDTLLTPLFARWQDAGTVDMVDEMMQLVIAAAIRILFSQDIDTRRLVQALEVVLADTWRRIEAPLDGALISPRLHRPAFRAARRTIDAMVLALIQDRRAAQTRPDDVLTRLLSAHEAEDAAALSDTELRDAAVTLLLAGHETTANAIAWALVHAAEGFAASPPAQLFAEALRLHPSIWVIERRAIRDDEIGGYHISRGTSVLISPYVLHRHPGFWPAPARFDPARFDGETPRLRAGYLPFGLGQHRCVGLHLANRMAEHIIARVLAEFELSVVPHQSPGHLPGITLRHSGPVTMRVRRR